MRGRYYLGRVVKMGLLDQQKLINAILNSPIVEVGKFDWTITDVYDGRSGDVPFVFGKLSKYAKHGSVKIVDEIHRSQIDASAPNLLEASSPFVYLPEFSGIAFLHVWNGIQENIFPSRFKTIIERAYDGFFVSCEVEPVADYRAFVARLKMIDTFTELSAKVYPPNPLFGCLWSSLHEYVKRRKASDVSIKETSNNSTGIKTEIVKLVSEIIFDPKFIPQNEVDIADAALLMAADGYGTGKVIGYEGNNQVIVKTSDSQKSFLFSKEPIPDELAKAVERELKSVSIERDIGH